MLGGLEGRSALQCMRSRFARRALRFLRSEAEQRDRFGVLHSFGVSTTGKTRGYLTRGYPYKVAVAFPYKVAVKRPTKWPWITFIIHKVSHPSLQSGRGLFQSFLHGRGAVVEGQTLCWLFAPYVLPTLRVQARRLGVFIINAGRSVERQNRLQCNPKNPAKVVNATGVVALPELVV